MHKLKCIKVQTYLIVIFSILIFKAIYNLLTLSLKLSFKAIFYFLNNRTILYSILLIFVYIFTFLNILVNNIGEVRDKKHQTPLRTSLRMF